MVLSSRTDIDTQLYVKSLVHYSLLSMIDMDKNHFSRQYALLTLHDNMFNKRYILNNLSVILVYIKLGSST